MNANRIEIHYHLPHGVHSADAFLLAKAETEFISIIKEVATALDITLKLETEALAEGGIKQIWKAIGDNAPQLSLLLSIVAIVIALNPPTDKELIDLQKEEARLHIEVLKKELAASEPENAAEAVDCVTNELNHRLNVVKRRSNFYQAIYQEQKIQGVSYTTLYDEVPTEDPTHLKREEFPNFFALTSNLPREVDEDATIGIISPVLKKGRFKWKGEYEGQVIEFWIQDQLFKDSVLSKDVEFRNGTAINCVLEIKVKVNEVGEVSNAGYYVTTVKKVIDDGFEFVTERGRAFAAKKYQEKNQLNLFSEES